MIVKKILPVLFLMLFYADAQAISPSEASKNSGKTVQVCGVIEEAVYESTHKGSPTYLYMGAEDFTAVIWGLDRKKFKVKPEEFYPGREVCVTGRITTYNRMPVIFVQEPGQIIIPKQRPAMTDEEADFFDKKEYHEYTYKPLEIKTIKRILRALGYKIPELNEYFDEPLLKAIYKFQEDNGIKRINGKLTRENILAMEKAINESNELSYRDKIHFYYMAEGLLKVIPKGKRFEDR